MKKSVKTAGKEHMERMREHFELTGVDLSNSGFLSSQKLQNELLAKSQVAVKDTGEAAATQDNGSGNRSRKA